MKKRTFILATMLLGLSHSSFAYNYPEYILFESTNRCPGCDLSHAQITSNHSRAKLPNANLSGISTLFGIANLSQADLSNTNMVAASLPNANFSQANLTGANLTEAHVENANFSGATGVDLKNAYACGATLADGSKMPPC